jgi:hypothetical protein
VSAYIVKDAGIETANIYKIVHNEFSVASKTNKYGAWSKGVLVLTDKEFFIYVKDSVNDKIKLDLRLTYTKIKGVDLVVKEKHSQIQILGVTGILALEPQWPDNIFNKQQATRDLYLYIKSKEVPDFTAKRMIKRKFEMPLIIPIPTPLLF